jgi:hypothetical protein
MTAPPSLLQLTNFLDTPVRLIFAVLFRQGTIFCLVLVSLPKAPSNWLGVAQNPKIHTQPKNCGPDSPYNSTISSPINRILTNLHRLIFLVLFRVYTILYVLLWWWPKLLVTGNPTQEMPTGFRLQFHHFLSD